MGLLNDKCGLVSRTTDGQADEETDAQSNADAGDGVLGHGVTDGFGGRHALLFDGVESLLDLIGGGTGAALCGGADVSSKTAEIMLDLADVRGEFLNIV